MLPTEVFAEVVAFLRLFDMSALVVTNAPCSSLALNAASGIRCEEFPDLDFYVSDHMIYVCRVHQVHISNQCMERRLKYVAFLDFQNESTMAEFIAAAFPNCVFMGVGLQRGASKQTLDAVGRVAGSVIVTEALGHYRDMSADDSISLVRKFRRLKVTLFTYFAARQGACVE